MCLLATSEFSHEAVKKHQETVITALKVWTFICFWLLALHNIWGQDMALQKTFILSVQFLVCCKWCYLLHICSDWAWCYLLPICLDWAWCYLLPICSDLCYVICCLFVQTERDVSVRQRAVDLLYAMCDRTNAEEIVGEMLEYLESADYSIREEMVRLWLFVSTTLSPINIFINYRNLSKHWVLWLLYQSYINKEILL